MKRIIFIRHAKACWKATTQSDHDRPLTKQGKSDASMMGRMLHDQNLIPDLILSSPARRAINTAHNIAEAVEYPKTSIRINSLIYDGTLGEHIDILKSLENKVKSIFWVAHNPYLTLMARWLLGKSIISVPPCGVIAVEIDISTWDLVDEGKGQKQFFDYPKNHDEGSV